MSRCSLDGPHSLFVMFGSLGAERSERGNLTYLETRPGRPAESQFSVEESKLEGSGHEHPCCFIQCSWSQEFRDLELILIFYLGQKTQTALRCIR